MRKVKRHEKLPISDMTSRADRLGSYTGSPSLKDGDDVPEQDVDDL